MVSLPFRDLTFRRGRRAMTHLRYTDGSRYAHLNRAAFPATYPDRATAEAERARIVAACGDREDIEVIDEGETDGRQ